MALTQSVTNSSQRVIIKLTKFWKEISNQYNACRVKSFGNENMNPGYSRDAIWLIPGTDLCGRVPLWNWRTQVRLADSTRPGPSLDKFWFDVIWRIQKYFGCNEDEMLPISEFEWKPDTRCLNTLGIALRSFISKLKKSNSQNFRIIARWCGLFFGSHILKPNFRIYRPSLVYKDYGGAITLQTFFCTNRKFGQDIRTTISTLSLISSEISENQ